MAIRILENIKSRKQKRKIQGKDDELQPVYFCEEKTLNKIVNNKADIIILLFTWCLQEPYLTWSPKSDHRRILFAVEGLTDEHMFFKAGDKKIESKTQDIG